MDSLINLSFNPNPPRQLHLDINSCFATVEQQANPLLRGKPIAVAAYNRPTCCVLAPSIEAKKFGIKTGMMVFEAKKLYPPLIILEPDPDKYRFIHHQLHQLLRQYCEAVIPKSIDEFLLDFSHHPSPDLYSLAQQIKLAINQKIGDHLTVSVGIGPNRFLAKVAAGLKKPNGLEAITAVNYLDVYQRLTLTDLTGINSRNQLRLNSVGISSVLDFYNSPYHQLFAAFRSVNAQDWYLRLRGYETDDREFARHSFGHSYVIPQPVDKPQALPIIQKLTHKAATRLRQNGFQTTAVSLALFYKDKTYWHQDHRLPIPLFSTSKIFSQIAHLFSKAPDKPIKTVALSCHQLVSTDSCQLNLFQDTLKELKLTQAVDQINQDWGPFTLTPARMVTAKNDIPDRIAFGR